MIRWLVITGARTVIGGVYANNVYDAWDIANRDFGHYLDEAGCSHPRNVYVDQFSLSDSKVV